MKTNRKARLNRRQTQHKRLAVLLTEMEKAAGEVLIAHFDFSQQQVDDFLEAVRQAMRTEPVKISHNPLHPNQHLTTTVQRFALVGMQILKQDHDFAEAQLDNWLGKLIEAGNRSRES